MAKKSIIRIWQKVDVDLIGPHLLIAGSLTADCGNCKEVNIRIDSRNCPNCKTAFSYIGTRISSSAKEAKRLRAKRPDLTVIEFADFKEVEARKKARGFLGG